MPRQKRKKQSAARKNPFLSYGETLFEKEVIAPAVRIDFPKQIELSEFDLADDIGAEWESDQPFGIPAAELSKVDSTGWNIEVEKRFKEMLPTELDAAVERVMDLAAIRTAMTWEERGKLPAGTADSLRQRFRQKENVRLLQQSGSDPYRRRIEPREEREYIWAVKKTLLLWTRVFEFVKQSRETPSLESLRNEFGTPALPVVVTKEGREQAGFNRFFHAGEYAPLWLLEKVLQKQPTHRAGNVEDPAWMVHAPKSKKRESVSHSRQMRLACLHAFALLKGYFDDEAPVLSLPSEDWLANRYYDLKRRKYPSKPHSVPR